MSMRLQINLLVAGLIALFLGITLYFQIAETRSSVRDETEAANRVATHLLADFVRIHADRGQAALVESLDRLGRVRSTEIQLRDHDGNLLHHSPPSPYKVGRDAPEWYSRLVAPAPMHQQLLFAGGVLDIEANASRSILDGWDQMRVLAETGLLLLVLGIALVFWLLRRVTRPLEKILDGLRDMEAGAYHTRLPAFAGEAGAIAQAFNRAAQAIEENLDARRQAAEAQRRLDQSQELAGIVQQRIEEERRLIAQELHDEMGQRITAIRSMAAAVAQQPEGGREAVTRAAKLIGDTAGGLYDSMQALIPRLRPPSLDELDLAAAIEELAATTRQSHPGMEVRLALGELPEPLGETFALTGFRVVQEAVTNALRHAEARMLRIDVRHQQGQLQIEVCDNGRGLTPEWRREGRYGIRGMRERVRALGGHLEVEKLPEGGVRVFASLPLEAT